MTPNARPAENVAFCDFAIQSVALLNVRLRKNAVRETAKFTRALVNSARNDALDVSQVAFLQRAAAIIPANANALFEGAVADIAIL